MIFSPSHFSPKKNEGGGSCYRDDQQGGQKVVDEVHQEALRRAKFPLDADGARNLREETDRRLQESVRWRCVREDGERHEGKGGNKERRWKGNKKEERNGLEMTGKEREELPIN